MLEYKSPTALSTYRDEGARAVRVLNHRLLPSPSTQTTTPSKIASSLLDFLISYYKGEEIEQWIEIKITLEEV